MKITRRKDYLYFGNTSKLKVAFYKIKDVFISPSSDELPTYQYHLTIIEGWRKKGATESTLVFPRLSKVMAEASLEKIKRFISEWKAKQNVLQ